jgi:hypothetical protein
VVEKEKARFQALEIDLISDKDDIPVVYERFHIRPLKAARRTLFEHFTVLIRETPSSSPPGE